MREIIFWMILILGIFSVELDPEEAVPDWLVEYVNNYHTTWRASKNTLFGKMSLKEAQHYVMNQEQHNPLESQVRSAEKEIFSKYSKKSKRSIQQDPPPAYFFYDHHPSCEKAPLDQTDICGSCWAVSVSQSCGDRFCLEYIKSTGTNATIINISPQELISCYYDRINPVYSYCGGAEHVLAMGYMLESSYGIVPNSCMKYALYDKGNPIQCPDISSFECRNSDYVHYNEDRYHLSGVTDIQTIPQALEELFNNGPIVTKYQVFSDFYSYSGGVYVKTPGSRFTGFHSVAIVGYGEEAGTPYWLIKNSWGEYAGSEQFGKYKGYFRIRRGTNECRIEEFLSSCVPLVECNHFCFDVCEDKFHVCSSHGTCVSEDHCECSSDYHGLKCNHLIVPSVSCHGINSSNHHVCSRHGACLNVDTCECDREYSGEQCESYKSCFGTDFDITMTVCSGHGECTGFNNCTCIVGYFGNDCSIVGENVWIYVFLIIGLGMLAFGVCAIILIIIIGLSPRIVKSMKKEWVNIKKENSKTLKEIKNNTKKKKSNVGMGNSMKLSKNEEKAIQNLMKLGFERHDCIQAYFACEKNENNAANFLFQDNNDDQYL